MAKMISVLCKVRDMQAAIAAAWKEARWQYLPYGAHGVSGSGYPGWRHPRSAHPVNTALPAEA